jgi:hypothetical protein
MKGGVGVSDLILLVSEHDFRRGSLEKHFHERSAEMFSTERRVSSARRFFRARPQDAFLLAARKENLNLEL